MDGYLGLDDLIRKALLVRAQLLILCKKGSAP